MDTKPNKRKAEESGEDDFTEDRTPNGAKIRKTEESDEDGFVEDRTPTAAKIQKAGESGNGK